MKPHIFFLLGLIVFFPGCQQDMVIDLPTAEPKVVVNSFFHTDSVFQLNLSKSRGPLEDEYVLQLIDSAKVEIYENGTRYDSLFSWGGYAYIGTKKPLAGGNYELRVTATGYPIVTAHEILPAQSVFSNLTIKDSASYSQNSGYEGEISFTLNDPAATENYYGIYLRTVDTMYTWPEEDTIIGTSEIYFNSLDPILSEGGFFDDKTFNGTARQFKISVSQYNLDRGTPLYFNLVAVSKKGYDYQKSLNLHLNAQGNPFAEPVQVYSNIEEGYGIFTGAVTNEVLIR